MLVLLPVIILLLSAVAIWIMGRVRPSYGYSWLTAVGASLLSWCILLLLHWQTADPMSLNYWHSAEGLATPLRFHIDNISWPYAFSLISLVLAVILTASIRLQLKTTPWVWIGSLAITGTGLLAIMASTSLTLIFAWMAIDLIEVCVVLFSINDRRLRRQAVVAFAARVMGTGMVVWAMVVSKSHGEVLNLSNVLPGVGFYILLAAGLRLGVIPLHLPYTKEVHLRRGLGTILRMVTSASSLVVLGRLPAWVVSPKWAIILLAFTALAAVYGAVMWVTAKDELNGRPYWLIALAGIALACAIRGRPDATLAWGATLILSGGLLFLYSERKRQILLLPLLGYLGMTGLPFTPAASGFFGLIVPPFNILDVILLMAHILLLVGYLRHIFRPIKMIVDFERWMFIVYPSGLLILVLTQWIIAVFGWSGSLTPGVWWAAFISVILSVIGMVLLYRSGYLIYSREAGDGWLEILMDRIGSRLAKFFSLDWLYRFLWFLYLLLQRLVIFSTSILEGDGGVLWALVLLVLLLTLISFGDIS